MEPRFSFEPDVGLFREQDDKNNIIEFPYDIKKIQHPYISSSSFHVNHLKSLFRDVARPNLFKVHIIPPLSLLKTDWDNKKTELLALAKAATMPQVSIKEWVYERAGQKLHIPTNEIDYGELNITFYNDIDCNLRTLFNRWQKLALYNWSTSQGSIPLEAVSGIVRLYQFDGQFNAVYAAEFTNAWPQTISSMELSQESENTAQEFSVDFKFTLQNIYKNYENL